MVQGVWEIEPVLGDSHIQEHHIEAFEKFYKYLFYCSNTCYCLKFNESAKHAQAAFLSHSAS